MANLEAEVRQLTDEFVRDIIELLRSAVVETVTEQLGGAGGAVTGRRVRARSGGAARPKSADKSGPGALSQQELKVLTMVAQGMSTRDIGETLGLSPRTVETYRLRIRRKLGPPAQSVAGMTQWALKHGLIS